MPMKTKAKLVTAYCATCRTYDTLASVQRLEGDGQFVETTRCSKGHYIKRTHGVTE